MISSVEQNNVTCILQFHILKVKGTFSLNQTYGEYLSCCVLCYFNLWIHQISFHFRQTLEFPWVLVFIFLIAQIIQNSNTIEIIKFKIERKSSSSKIMQNSNTIEISLKRKESPPHQKFQLTKRNMSLHLFSLCILIYYFYYLFTHKYRGINVSHSFQWLFSILLYEYT